MTEAIEFEQSLLVPSRFAAPLYCGSGGLAQTPLDVLTTYDPEAVGASFTFINELGREYHEIKGPNVPRPPETDNTYRQPTLDLRNSAGIDCMITHTVTHAITGFLDSGTSDTNCIPYWDREAVIVGAWETDAAIAQGKIELMDALSMNVLRAHLEYYNMFGKDHLNRIQLLSASILKGQVSMVNMAERQERRRNHNSHELDEYATLYVPKLKHFAWLVDQQLDPAVRERMLPEVEKYVRLARTVFGVTDDRLIINMGADTGISEATDRPPYDTAVFVQLAHIHDKTRRRQSYSMAQEHCHRLPMADMIASIARPGMDLPFYEQDGRYHLPWKFN